MIECGSPRHVKDFGNYNYWETDALTSSLCPTATRASRASTVTPSLSSQFSEGIKTSDRLNESYKNKQKCYKLVEKLGDGSMGSVYRVMKQVETRHCRKEKRLWREQKRNQTQSSCFLFCPFAARSRQDILDVIPPYEPDEQKSFLKLQNKNKNNNNNSTSKHLHKGYALKTASRDGVSSNQFRKVLENEVQILRVLDHPNIVRSIETLHHKSEIFMVMELCSGGDLYARDHYTEKHAAKIIKSVLSAIAYMHSRDIIHRDIKFENVLFINKEEDSDVKLIDFGLSKQLQPSSTSVGGENNNTAREIVGTLYTMAPEMLEGKGYTSSIDIWSIGVMTFMLLSNDLPIFGNDRKSVIKQILKGEYNFNKERWDYVSSDAKNFITLLLQQDPEQRPTALCALEKAWFHRRQLEDKRKENSVSTVVMDSILTTIETFADYSLFQKLVLVVLAHRSTTEEIGSSLCNAFDMFCDIRNGGITLSTFKAALKDYQLVGEREAETLFSGMDVDGNGIVDYSEFLAATLELNGRIAEDRLFEAFRILDTYELGYITLDGLKRMLPNMKHLPATLVLEEAVGAVDVNNQDGEMSYCEFLTMWDCDTATQLP